MSSNEEAGKARDSSPVATSEHEQLTEPSMASAPVVVPASRRGVWEWLWQPSIARELSVARRSVDEWTQECRRRARLCAGLGAQLVHDAETSPHGAPLPVAAQLYRDSVLWSLVAAHVPGSEKLDELGFSGLWTSYGEAALLAHFTTEPDRAEVETFFQWTSPSLVWEEPHSGLDRILKLRRLSERLIQAGDEAMRRHEALWFQRLIRLGLPFVVLVLGAGLGFALYSRHKLAEETTFPWRTSSTYSDPQCASPSQVCDNELFFFATQNESNPWIEFDLGRTRDISKVHIANRVDCSGCSSRAVPLIVEVSQDQKTWSEVARRKQDFTSWAAKFPSTEARWLRLRVPRRTFLHLKQVRIPH